ncbi:unnamed protein product [Rotaria socialis]
MRIIQKLCSIRLVDQLYVDINLESNKDDEVNHSVHSLTIPDEHFQSLQCCYHRNQTCLYVEYSYLIYSSTTFVVSLQ